MKTYIISDVHGNLPALEAVLARCPDADRWLCLGDTVNYGPWSNECVEIIDSLPGSTTIMGNHEEFYLRGDYGGSSEIGRAFFDHCFPDFSKADSISAFPASVELDDFHCIHTLDGRYLFHDSEIEIDRDCMIGHSHQQYQVERTGFQLVNPGSVGQDRKYINRANYAIYDHLLKEVELKSFLYDIDVVLREMRARSYPQICLDYYLSKQRL